MTAPALRFKEFDGDWKESRLKDLALKITDGTHDTPAVQKEGIPFLTAINVKDGFINYDDIAYVDEITHKKIYERCNPEKDDLLIVNIGAGTATCARNIVDYQFSLKNVALVKPNRNLLNPIFLEQIQRKNSSRLFTSLTSGGAQPFLSLKEIGKLLIKYPSLEEQTKIATFLSAVDEKISQLSQKLHLLGQYKQGMMQKLFSQQIRFKAEDGSDFGEWESKTLGEVGENIIGLTYSPTDVTNDGSGILVLRSSNIKNGRLDKNDQVRVNKKIKEKIIVQPNDILICTRNGSQRLIGKSVILNDDEVMTFGAFMSVYRSRSNRFIAYLMQTPWFFEQVQMNLGARINQITTGTLNEFTFDFPCFEEQTKIANFLSAIDQKIDVVSEQLEQAKLWKKGLLQQMFV